MVFIIYGTFRSCFITEIQSMEKGKCIFFFFCLVLSVLSVRLPVYPIPQSDEPQALYPDWAHDHWVWLHNSVSNQSNVMSMVQGYLSYNIKVGAIDIDSDWSTGINNFVFDTKKVSKCF